MALYKAAKTVLTKKTLINMLNEGWKELYGKYPKKESLAVLSAQVCIETGLKFCWLNNLGNIKRYGEHDWQAYRCSEIINGKEEWFDPPHKMTQFCAYLSPSQGAKEYIEFVSKRKRYQKAWQSVLAGDPKAYAINLHDAGYYTASVALYSKGCISLFNMFMKDIDSLLDPNCVFTSVNFECITEDYFSKPTEQPTATVTEPEIVSDLPDLSEFGIEIIPFNWTDESHLETIPDELPLTLTSLEKIFSLILQFIKMFQKKS
jgi:hypothetical protein